MEQPKGKDKEGGLDAKKNSGAKHAEQADEPEHSE